MTEPVRCAFFVRVSTEEQDVAQQLDELNEWARRRQYAVCQVYREPLGTTASKVGAPRPELERALRDVRQKPRPWDVLLAFKLDRVTRLGSVEGHALLKTLYDAGARVETLHDSIPWDVPIARDILLALTFAIAQQESATISARTTAARAAIRKGTRDGKLGGRPRRLTPEKVSAIVALRKDKDQFGAPYSWAAIAQRVGLPAATCRRAFYEHRVATGVNTRRPTPAADGSGRGMSPDVE